MARKPHVALIVETSSRYGREILRGITRFLRTHAGWSIFLEQSALTTEPPAWLNDWKGEGIISRATNPQLVEALKSSGVPLVELTDRHGDFGLPHIWSDDWAIGRLGAEHLLERGFRHFAACGFSREYWSEQRLESFEETIRKAGFECDIYESPWHAVDAHPWEEEQHELVGWLQSLSKPTGILACNDVRGQHVLDASSRIDLAVPEEIAVLGVDNDKLLCELCAPPLSSIIPNPERVGYLAAELLDRLMSGKKPKDQEQLVKPLGVATRQSTDVFAIDDPHVATAMRFIREHACRGVTVKEVLERVPLSRSALERRFRKYLRRSPQKEIRNLQLKRVKQLLAETDLSLERIATLTGYEHPEYMSVVFKRETGETPGHYRGRVHPDAASR